MTSVSLPKFSSMGRACSQKRGGIAGRTPKPRRFSPGGRMNRRDCEELPLAGQRSTCPPTRIEGGNVVGVQALEGLQSLEELRVVGRMAGIVLDGQMHREEPARERLATPP